jgi:sugar/nucleoside kinase (ribokinase family)
VRAAILGRMAVDVAVAIPAFLDLTFVGLEALPAPGEERFAGDLVRSPGGGAIHAVASARLGLSAALATPLGDDADADYLREALRSEGVALAERRAGRTATTVVLPVANDRAMVTVDPGARANPAEVAAFEPAAVAANVDMLYCVPAGVPAYATCGDDDARAFARQPLRQLEGVHVLFVSEREALTLSGSTDLERAFGCLCELADSVVVTLGASGATGIIDGERVSAPGVSIGSVVDTTGAGDLLVAAYIWAELRGTSREDRLRWAVLYSALSVTTPTAIGGAVTEKRLLDEGERLGLSLPAAI